MKTLLDYFVPNTYMRVKEFDNFQTFMINSKLPYFRTVSTSEEKEGGKKKKKDRKRGRLIEH